MAAFIPNISAGRVARLAQLPETADGLVWILLQSTGLVTDAALRDIDDIGTLLAGATDEATFTGYARIAAVGVTVTVDDTNDRVDVDVTTDPSWNPTTAQGLGKIVLAYDNDTGAGTDTNLVPIFYDDFVMTTPTGGAGTPITYQVAAAGFARATPA